MIKLNPEPTFWHDVRLTVPGQAEPALVPMELAYMTAEQSAAFYKEHETKLASEVLHKVVRNWGAQAVRADDGTFVPFSYDALTALMKNYQPAASEIWRDWQAGLSQSRVKN